MNGNVSVLGDWGTSHLRLFLCRGETVIDRRDGPGIARLAAGPEDTLFDLLAPWIAAHGRMPILLAGMVGSRNGWKEVPYAPCPADRQALARAMLRFRAREHAVLIAPGLSCRNPSGAIDLLRGEETQILGSLERNPALTVGRHLLCLPGTHAKWVLLAEGSIVTFQTSLAGEVFDLLEKHSILLRVAGSGSGDERADRSAFEAGLARSRELAPSQLLHVLFETRSLQLQGELSASQAKEWLSGLLIGSDTRGALALFAGEHRDEKQVLVIGATSLAERYRTALEAFGVPAVVRDAGEMTLAGLTALARYA